MKAELVTSYKRVLAGLLNALIEEQIPHTGRMLERIEDDMVDVREAFEKEGAATRPPVYWISILRFMRFAQILQRKLMSDYDVFVEAYGKLSGLPGRGEDEEQLRKEMGDYLYHVDELVGIVERLIPKMIADLHKVLIETYGLQLEPNEDFYRGKINREGERLLGPTLRELVDYCAKVVAHEKIHDALDRMRKVLLGG